MTKRTTIQGCTVETTYVLHDNDTRYESIVLSVDPSSTLSINIEERAGQLIGTRTKATPPAPRFRR